MFIIRARTLQHQHFIAYITRTASLVLISWTQLSQANPLINTQFVFCILRSVSEAIDFHYIK